MSNSELPTCRDFICEVVREIRQAPRQARQTAPAGTSVKRLYEFVATSPYNDTEYRAAIMELLEDGTIVFVCSCSAEGISSRAWHDAILEVDTIPSWYDFKTKGFDTDYKGNRFDVESHRRDGESIPDFFARLRTMNYICYHGITLYIAEDGLPLRAQRALKKSHKTGSAKSRTDAIIKRLRRS